jgi:hypothetical protein
MAGPMPRDECMERPGAFDISAVKRVHGDFEGLGADARRAHGK